MACIASLSLFLVVCVLACLTGLIEAHPAKNHRHADAHLPLTKRLPNTWYQPEGHPVHALFRRQDSAITDGVDYAEVGSPTWSAPFPTHSPDPSNLPQPWVDALNAAVSAGNIPSLPQTTFGGNGNPVYPDGLDPTSNAVCSGTYQCYTDSDITDAPDGIAGASFDDGPLPTSPQLYQFLQEQGVHATHFMIGVNILNNPSEFSMAFDTNEDDIGVHTWTHPYMTTLDNLQILGELGWTMQIIHNSTGGRLPRFWRPPYGDADVRVRAIAEQVFGLTTVFWNKDTSDWELTTGGTTPSKVHASLERWYGGSRSPGLIILEHELSNASVQAYIDAFPLIAQNGWQITSVAQLDGGSAYQNVGEGGSVDAVENVLGYPGTDEDEDDGDYNLTFTATSVETSTAASASMALDGVGAGGAVRPTFASFASSSYYPSAVPTRRVQKASGGSASRLNIGVRPSLSGLVAMASIIIAAMVLA